MSWQDYIQQWKIGKFFVAVEVVNNNNDFAEVLALMKFVPYTVYFDYLEKKFVYIGTSSLFEEITIRSSVPEYSISIKISNGNVCVEARRL